MKQTRKELAVNMFNLLQAVRDAIFPAIMFALMALGTLVTSPKAEVISPNGVPISSDECDETSPTKPSVTVCKALESSSEKPVREGFANSGAPYLNLEGSGNAHIWASQKDGTAEIKMSVIDAQGSVTYTCVVTTVLEKGQYQSKCKKQ